MAVREARKVVIALATLGVEQAEAAVAVTTEGAEGRGVGAAGAEIFQAETKEAKEAKEMAVAARETVATVTVGAPTAEATSRQAPDSTGRRRTQLRPRSTSERTSWP